MEPSMKKKIAALGLLTALLLTPVLVHAADPEPALPTRVPQPLLSPSSGSAMTGPIDASTQYFYPNTTWGNRDGAF